jgi:hypothetical protein
MATEHEIIARCTGQVLSLENKNAILVELLRQASFILRAEGYPDANCSCVDCKAARTIWHIVGDETDYRALKKAPYHATEDGQAEASA